MLHGDECLGPRFKLGKQTRRVHQIEQQTDTFRIDLPENVQRSQARLTVRDNQRSIAIGAYLAAADASDRSIRANAFAYLRTVVEVFEVLREISNEWNGQFQRVQDLYEQTFESTADIGSLLRKVLTVSLGEVAQLNVDEVEVEVQIDRFGRRDQRFDGCTQWRGAIEAGRCRG